jgi:hypothetical protein
MTRRRKEKERVIEYEMDIDDHKAAVRAAREREEFDEGALPELLDEAEKEFRKLFEDHLQGQLEDAEEQFRRKYKIARQ